MLLGCRLPLVPLPGCVSCVCRGGKRCGETATFLVLVWRGAAGLGLVPGMSVASLCEGRQAGTPAGHESMATPGLFLAPASACRHAGSRLGQCLLVRCSGRLPPCYVASKQASGEPEFCCKMTTSEVDMRERRGLKLLGPKQVASRWLRKGHEKEALAVLVCEEGEWV